MRCTQGSRRMSHVTEHDIDHALALRMSAWLDMSPTPLSFQRLAAAFHLSKEEQDFYLTPALDYLASVGKIKILTDKKGTQRYQSTKPNSPVMVARITGRLPSGHIAAEPISWAGDHPPQIRIKKKHHTGLGLEIGDHLLVAVRGAEKDRLNARILQRLSDYKEARLTGRFEDTHIVWARGKLTTSFAIASSECKDEINKGDTVEFSLCDDLPQEYPQAHVRRFIFEPGGRIDRLGDIALINRGLTRRYPNKFEEAAAAIAAQGVKPNDHYFSVNLPFLTIDPEHAKDHDDAVYASPRKDGGFDIFIAIADAAYYVRSGTELDKRARMNGTSLYPMDRVAHMLPQAFAENLLSLKQNQLRRAMILHVTLDGLGQMIHAAPYRGLVRVHRNISYDRAEEILSGRDSHPESLYKILKDLESAYHLLRPSLHDDRDLELLSGKILPVIDPQTGRITGFEEKMPNHAHDMIEKFMLLANKTVAQLLDEKNIPYLRRAHDRPDALALHTAEEALKKLGFEIPSKGLSHPSQFNNFILKAAAHPSLSFEVRQIIGGLIPKAYYTQMAQAHWGLNCDSYTHFTSPIRRYADIITHRALITAYPNLGEGGLSQRDIEELDKISSHLNHAEKRARDVEHDVRNLYTQALMSSYIGQTIPANLISVHKKEAFLESPLIPFPIKMPAADFRDAALGTQIALKVFHADPLSGRLEFLRASKNVEKETGSTGQCGVSYLPPRKHTGRKETNDVVEVVALRASKSGGIPKTEAILKIGRSQKTLTLRVEQFLPGALTTRTENGQNGIYCYEKGILIIPGTKFRLYTQSCEKQPVTYRAQALKQGIIHAAAKPRGQALNNLADLQRFIA